MSEIRPPGHHYLIAIGESQDPSAVIELLNVRGIPSRWVAATAHPLYQSQWELADENCWPLLQHLLEDDLEQAADATPVPAAAQREIIRLSVELWNFTSEAGLDQTNLHADHQAGRIPHYPPQKQEPH